MSENKHDLEIEQRSLSSLKHTLDNPRKHTASNRKKIKKSLLYYGFVNPLIVNTDNEIIVGHQRANQAMNLGMDKAPVIEIDMEGAEEVAYAIFENKIQEESFWDLEELYDILQDLKEGGVSYQLTGFHDTDIKDLGESLGKEEEVTEKLLEENDVVEEPDESEDVTKYRIPFNQKEYHEFKDNLDLFIGRNRKVTNKKDAILKIAEVYEQEYL